jgi:hypothetical protein
VPGSGATYPGAHPEQVEAVVAGCSKPGAHGVQVWLPTREKDPDGQGWHRKYVGLRYG